MSALVIDDRGYWWNGSSREFRETFYLGDVSGDVASMLIDKMGFIGVSLRRAGPVIRFSPKYVAAPALARVGFWLCRNEWRRLGLVYPGEDQRAAYRLVDSSGAALQAILALTDQARGPQLPFTALSDTLEHLDNVAALGPVFDHWRNSRGVYVDAEYRPLLSQRARDRYIIFSPSSRDGDLKIVQAGMGLHIPDKQSHAALLGSQLADVADQAFAQWTSSIYRGVLNQQEPRFDHIYALINWPRAGRVERRYSRLILPCTTKDGQKLLLGISCDPGTPDLDLEAA